MSSPPMLSLSSLSPSPMSPLRPTTYPPWKEWYGTIKAVSFFPDGRRIATAGHRDNSTRVWDLETGEQDGEPFMGHTMKSLTVAVSKNGKDVATGGADNKVFLWKESDRITHKVLFSGAADPSQPHQFQIFSVALTSTSYPLLLASGGSEGVVNIWDIKEDAYTTPTTRICVKGAIISLQFSPSDSSRIAVTSTSEKKILLYNALSGQQLFELSGHTTHISSFTWFPGGQRLVSTGDSLRIWDTRAGTQVGEPLFGHGRFVKAITVSPDGKYIASGSNDGTVRVWSVATRGQIGTPITVSGVDLVRFSPDAKSLLTVSKESGVQMWPMEHLEVEEGMKLTKEVIDGLILSSEVFRDELRQKLDDEFTSARDSTTTHVQGLTTVIDYTANVNHERLDTLDGSLAEFQSTTETQLSTIKDRVDALSDKQETDLQTLKSALGKSVKRTDEGFKDVKETINSVSSRQDNKYNELHNELRGMKTDIQNIQKVLSELSAFLKNPAPKSGGLGPSGKS